MQLSWRPWKSYRICQMLHLTIMMLGYHLCLFSSCSHDGCYTGHRFLNLLEWWYILLVWGALCEMERSLGGTGTAAVDTTQVFKRWAGVDVPRHCKHIWCYGMFTSVALAHMVNATLCSRDSNMKTVMSCLGTSKVEMTVLLLRKANLVFGVIALPHKVDTLESHIFKQILQMSRFSYKNYESQKTKSA